MYQSFHVDSGSHWDWHLGPGGAAGGAGVRLFHLPVQLPRASAAGPWSLVLPAHVQVPTVLLLQELCLHPLWLLVCLLLWLLCPGQCLIDFGVSELGCLLCVCLPLAVTSDI